MSSDRIKVAIITVSDRCSAEPALDLSGAYLESAFNQQSDKYEVVAKAIVPDEFEAIQVKLNCNQQIFCKRRVIIAHEQIKCFFFQPKTTGDRSAIW